jgi:non-ribosomal peptide synthetase component E (peptide arylation enzyme)
VSKPTLYTEQMISEYMKAGYWDTITLSDYWERNARDYPDKEAITDSRIRLTWAEAKQWIDRLSLGLLELGFNKDDLIVIQLPNCVELVMLRLACERAGLIYAPVLRTLRHTEIEYLLKYLNATALVIPWKYRDFDYFGMVQELRPRLPNLKYIFIHGDDVPSGTISIKALLQNPLETKYPPNYLDGKKSTSTEVSLVALTTGTTGNPKCIETPVCCRLSIGRANLRSLKITSSDVFAALTPAALGPNVLPYFSAPQVGAKVSLLEHWSVEEALRLIEEEKVTIPCVVPAQLAELAAYPDLERHNINSMRVIFSAGASLPFHMVVGLEGKLGIPIVQAYGTVDYGGVAVSSIDDPLDARLLTVGKPYQGNEIKLLDEWGKAVADGQVGEIIVRGAASSSGYYLDPDMTFKIWDQNGWYRTGDLGKFDKEGNLVIVGRGKDIIIRGGQNIYPGEVEDLLLTHPKVANAAIVGIPDPIMGERVCACVVTEVGEDFSFDEMISFLKTKRIAPYKLPERLVLLNSLPYAGGLKLDRKALKAETIDQLRAEGGI